MDQVPEPWPVSLNPTLMGAQLRRAPTVDLVLSAASIEDQLEGAGGGPSAPPARPSPVTGYGNGAPAGGDGAQRSNGAGANTGEWRGAGGAGARRAACRFAALWHVLHVNRHAHVTCMRSAGGARA